MEYGVGKILFTGLGVVVGGFAVKHVAREIENWNKEWNQKQLEESYRASIRRREDLDHLIALCDMDDVDQE